MNLVDAETGEQKYDNLADLLPSLREKIIAPAEAAIEAKKRVENGR